MKRLEAQLALLTPYEGRHLRTPNRVVLAPMTRNRAGDERTPNEMMATYYVQRAGAGLSVTESADVSPQAVGYPGTPGIYTDEHVRGWRRVVEAVRQARGAARAPFFCQLFHTGRVSHESFQPDGAPPIAPSAVRADVQLYTAAGMVQAATPRALETAEVATVVEHYAHAARCAIEAGFDGVEINAGNGYLVDQFLRDKTNRRSDRYGGSAANRARFLLEIVEAVGAAIGHSKVAVRVSPINPTNDIADSDPAGLFTTVAALLDEKEIAYLHVIEAADRATITPQIRQRFRGTLIANDSYDRDRAERALREGTADLVSFGRLFISNPDLPYRFSLDAPMNQADAATFYGGTDIGYTSYPALGG